MILILSGGSFYQIIKSAILAVIEVLAILIKPVMK